MRLEKDLNVGVWFDIPNDPDNASACLRIPGLGALKKINKKTASKKTEYKKLGRGNNYQRFEYDDPDEEKREELIWDYCIVDWKDIFDADGTKLECTTENKVRLMNGSIVFALFVADSLELLTASQTEKQEDEEKN